MQPDPAIDEIRAVRRKISAEFGHDPRRLVAHYLELEQEARRTGAYKFRDVRVEPAEESLILQDKPRKEQS